MRTRRFFTFLLVILPSVVLPAGATALGAFLDTDPAGESVATAPVRDFGGNPHPGRLVPPPLSLDDQALEARLLREAEVRVAAERAARERAAVERATAQRIARERASRAANRPSPTAPPAPVQAAAVQAAAGVEVWVKLRNCEAGGNYTRNSGNGYYGAYQFAAGTWRSLGYQGLPHEAPPEVQDEAAHRLQARGGWGQWPACSRRIGVR